MRVTLGNCVLLLSAAVSYVTTAEFNVTDVNVSTSHDVETTSNVITKDYNFTTEPGTTDLVKSTQQDELGVKDNVSTTSMQANASDVTPHVTVAVLTETEDVNQTFSRDANATETIFSTTSDNPTFASNGSGSSPSVTLTSCEMTTERRLSVIQSPGFPSTYAPDVECQYVVKRYSLDVCSVTFLFNVFDLELSDGCSKDYIDLHGERLCGSKTVGLARSVPFQSAVDDQVVLRFRSDSSTSGLGFMATVVQQECPQPDCDHKFTGLKFEIRSPGFPGPYENRQLCDYTVVRAGPGICRIRFQVRLFDVEVADHCEADSLEIKGDKLCGNIPAGEIVSVDFREPLLMIRFRTDHTTTRDGFHLLGTQEECPAEGTSTNSTGTKALSR